MLLVVSLSLVAISWSYSVLTKGTPGSEVAVKVLADRFSNYNRIDMPARDRLGGAWLRGALTCRASGRHRP
jgi:hypothetical protein